MNQLLVAGLCTLYYVALSPTMRIRNLKEAGFQYQEVLSHCLKPRAPASAEGDAWVGVVFGEGAETGGHQ